MEPLNRSTRYLLSLIRQYFESGGKDCSVPAFAPEADFDEIMRLAALNSCDPFVYHTIWRWGAEYGMDEEVLKSYKNRMLLSAIGQLRADAELKEVIAALNSGGIEFLLLKGVILSSLYPDPAYRRSCDADIHVSDEYADLATKILTDRGYVYIPDEYNKNEKTYRLEGILAVDLHTKLFENFYEKNRAAILSTGLELQCNRREVRVLDSLAETLAPNHFLIYVLCHHTKHFIYAGINLRHLIDICVFVNEYCEHLDWEFIISSLERFYIKDFIINILYICQHYLGMVDVSFLYDGIEDEVVTLLLQDIVEKDLDKADAMTRASVHEFVRGTYYGGKKNVANVIKFSLFPDAKSLSSRYAYAKKHPVLLPVAWVHRALSNLWRKMRGQATLSPVERSKFAQERVELLMRLRIL